MFPSDRSLASDRGYAPAQLDDRHARSPAEPSVGRPCWPSVCVAVIANAAEIILNDAPRSTPPPSHRPAMRRDGRGAHSESAAEEPGGRFVGPRHSVADGRQWGVRGRTRALVRSRSLARNVLVWQTPPMLSPDRFTSPAATTATPGRTGTASVQRNVLTMVRTTEAVAKNYSLFHRNTYRFSCVPCIVLCL